MLATSFRVVRAEQDHAVDWLCLLDCVQNTKNALIAPPTKLCVGRPLVSSAEITAKGAPNAVGLFYIRHAVRKLETLLQQVEDPPVRLDRQLGYSIIRRNAALIEFTLNGADDSDVLPNRLAIRKVAVKYADVA